MRLTEALSVSPEDEAARWALAEHLSDLRQSAGELGFVHLEAAVAEALSRLERESFGPGSLVAVRVLAWRYEILAAMPSQSGAHRVVRETEPPPAKVSLRGRRVLVADADAEARWFHVGVLREAGARVIEARDGVHALELARDDAPDLVLAAVKMPRLDGLGLCAAFRREPALDGVPVILLSRRVPAHEILGRVSRMLEPIIGLEQWLESDHEASGDLEELGVSGLLRAVRRLRPNATMILQDPWSLFDMELQEGRIVAASRTAIDGSVTRDSAAFPPLVGMSSGRFVVAASSATARQETRESLDVAFAEATHRLGAVLGAMAAHSDCRVELDQDVLGTYLRHSPTAIQRLIERLVAGEPPNALWESGAGSRGLVDAVLVTLARQGAVLDVRVRAPGSDRGPAPGLSPRSGGELIAPENQQDSPQVADPIERENVRAQSAVAMHREPANLATDWGHPIWRPNVRAAIGRPESDSELQMKTQTTPRLPHVLGVGFAVLLSATVGVILWHQVVPGAAPTGLSEAATAPAPASGAVEVAPSAAPTTPPSGAGVSAFSGSLREGIDPSLEVTEGQGVLELVGPGEVRVEVDGVDRGALPVTLALDQGTHVVTYRTGARLTYRFYYVKSGATRGLRVLTQAGGLVDAR